MAAPHFQRFSVSSVVWSGKSSEEHGLLQRFMAFKYQNQNDGSNQQQVSTDGKLKIPKTTLTARKPGQREKIRNSKTLSLCKK